ncbi:hypothetical protein VTH82DRAFT_7718 [Thermothelomyces myriococcoides]
MTSYPPLGPSYQTDPRNLDRGNTTDPRSQSDPRSRQSEAPASNGYPRPPDAQTQPPAVRAGGYGPDYYRYPQPGPYSYGMAAAGLPPSQQQSAPRQRTSIACRYCRKRKIRCSGYTHTANGKCANCDKLRIDCIFQPVSSNSSAAFVPVSAVPGGVPPGTPLYGAYGQPLPPSGASAPQGRTYPYPPSDHNTPQNHPTDLEPWRRSPASLSSGDSPPPSYQGSYGGDRAPTASQNSPGRSMPPQQPLRAPQAGASQTPPQPQSQASPQPKAQSNPMSLDNLVGPGPLGAVNDIDRNMLGRLNRRS